MSSLNFSHSNIKSKKKYIPKDVALNRTTSIKLYKFAKKLRIVEEELAKEYHPANQMRCPVHFCIGQEAVPAALNSLLKKKRFFIFSS